MSFTACVKPELMALTLASARLSAFFLVLPLLSRSIVTGTVRFGVLTAFAVVVQPAVRAALRPRACPPCCCLGSWPRKCCWEPA